MRRLIVLFVAVLAMVATFITPAGARPPSGGQGGTNEKVTICHATRSLQNPYVVITIDVAAWQPDGSSDDPRAHGPNHDREKNGFKWTDEKLDPGESIENCGPPDPPPSGSGPCDGLDSEIVIDLSDDEFKLWNVSGRQTYVFSEFDEIGAGKYEIVLVSWDEDHDPDTGDPYDQRNERWRAKFPGRTTQFEWTSFTPDLDGFKGGTPSDAVATSVGRVDIGATSSFVAEHWSFANETDSGPNSVIPLCVGLTPVDGGAESG